MGLNPAKNELLIALQETGMVLTKGVQYYTKNMLIELYGYNSKRLLQEIENASQNSQNSQNSQLVRSFVSNELANIYDGHQRLLRSARTPRRNGREAIGRSHPQRCEARARPADE